MTTPAAKAEQILNWTYADAQSRAQQGLERIDALAAQYPDDPAVTDVGTMLTRLADSVARTTGGTVTVQLRDAGMLSGGEISEQVLLTPGTVQAANDDHPATCPHCGCSQHDATELAAWEHEARGKGGEWIADLQARHPGVQLELSRKPTGNVQLSLIRTKDNKSQGLAEAAMRDLTQQADRTGTTLQLTPEPLAGDHTTSKSRLTTWYARHGFVPNRGRHMDYTVSDTMVRPPAI